MTGWKNGDTFSPIRHVTYVLAKRGKLVVKLRSVCVSSPEFQSNFFSKYVFQVDLLSKRPREFPSQCYVTKCFYAGRMADVKTPRRYIGDEYTHEEHRGTSGNLPLYSGKTFHPSRSNMYRNVSSAV